MAVAEIDIVVKNLQKLRDVQTSIDKTSASVERLNNLPVLANIPFSMQRINSLTQQAQANVDKQIVGSKRQKVAIRQLVIATNERLAAEKQISAEIARQGVLQSRFGRALPTFGRAGGAVAAGGTRVFGRGGLGGALGGAIPGAIISGAFPLLTGQGAEAGIGGAVGGLAGGVLGALLGPGGAAMGSFAGGLVGSIIGERIGEAKRLTEELNKQQGIVRAINGLEERRSKLTVAIAKAQQQGNDALTIELERRQKNNELAQKLFETITKLEADERNKTKEGKAVVDLEKQRAYQAANRAVNENNVLSALRQQQAALEKQVQASDMLAERRGADVAAETAKAEQQVNLATARFDMLMKVNDLELQRARNAGDTAKEYKLQLDRANLIYQQTVLQIQQELQRNKLAAIREKIELLRLQSELKAKQQAGENVELLRQSVDLQRQAVELAFQGVTAAQQIAQYQITGAQAVRTMAIEQAKFNQNKAAGAAIGGGMAAGGATVTSTATTRSLASATPQQLARALSAQGITGVFTEQQASQLLRQAAQKGTTGTATQGYAEGGFVTRPTNAMVGEGGQPEYVIPASKMNDAMRRYSAGTRGEAVVNGAGASGGMSSTTNYSSQQNAYYGSGGGTSVNITTGPVMRLDNKNYVTVSDMQRGMAAAVGAAEANMMSRMSRSYAARRSMGL